MYVDVATVAVSQCYFSYGFAVKVSVKDMHFNFLKLQLSYIVINFQFQFFWFFSKIISLLQLQLFHHITRDVLLSFYQFDSNKVINCLK